MESCPFKAGDIVVYTPSVRGRGLVTMTKLVNLVPGEKYKISRVEKDAYIVIEGFEDTPGGGLYWTEFTSA